MRVHTLYLAMLLASCGVPDSSELDTTIPNTNTSHIRLGSGYNSLTGEVGNNCGIVGETISEDSQSTYFSMRKIETMESLKTYLNINASTSFSSGIYKGSAQAKYFKSLKFNQFTSYMIVTVNVENAKETLKEFTIKEDHLKLLNTKPQAFLDTCGDELVVSRVTGGEFMAIVEFFASNREEKEEIDAKIRASGGVFKVATDFRSKMEALSSVGSVNVEIFRRGGLGKLPAFADLIQAALDFPDEVTRKPWTLSYSTVPIRAIAQSANPPIHLQNQVRLLEAADRMMTRALMLRNDIAYVLLNLSSFDVTTGEIENLKKAHSDLSSLVNTYLDQANKCFGDPIEGCKWPDPKIPTIRLPRWIGSEGLPPMIKCEASMRGLLARDRLGPIDYDRYVAKGWGPVFERPHDYSGKIDFTECTDEVAARL